MSKTTSITKTLKIRGRAVGGFRYERREVSVGRKGEARWERRTARWLTLRLGAGAGYRSGWLPGRTLTLGRWVKPNYLYRQQSSRNRGSLLVGKRWSLPSFYATTLSRSANRDVYPGWY